MDLRRDALLCAAAALAGAVNSIAGGGTLLSFPAAIAWGLPSTVANATNSVALMPGSLASAWAYRGEIRASATLARWLVPPAVIGSIAGALLLHVTPVRVFDALIPWLVLGATLLILFQGRVPSVPPSVRPTPGTKRRRALLAVGCQLGVGVYGGFFGAGMGIVMLAFLTLVVPGDIHHRNGLKNLLAVAINGVAAIYFVSAGLVNMRAAAIMTAGAVTGGYVGGQLARRVPGRVVRGIVVSIGLGLSALLAYRAW
ncbi:MAG TPA: sulfite exporter TauE/SafE family protein [Polyangiaceae bacterium]|nr:sulfite exporter TauE/SafE family protein [Polyangiaceae bacterium]